MHMAFVWVSCQSNMHGACVSCASVAMQSAVYRWKWLEGHVAPPSKLQFIGQGIHTAISLRDLRDVSLETPPDRHLNCTIQITYCDENLHTHGPKYCHSNDQSNYAIRMIIQTVHFALM